jgi:hypothetical protein
LALRSRYREKIPATETSTPDIPERVQPSERAPVDFTVDNKAEPAIAAVSADEIPEPDEATLALQKQLADLKKSEELQRQYAQQMAAQRQHAQRSLSREEKLSAWRANGGDEGDISFLESHPEMIDRHDVTVAAYAKFQAHFHLAPVRWTQ